MTVSFIMQFYSHQTVKFYSLFKIPDGTCAIAYGAIYYIVPIIVHLDSRLRVGIRDHVTGQAATASGIVRALSVRGLNINSAPPSVTSRVVLSDLFLLRHLSKILYTLLSNLSSEAPTFSSPCQASKRSEIHVLNQYPSP